jgi:hypothetical protein
MYAVIKTGGKQYRVTEGDVISFEKLPYWVGDEVEFDRVLLVSGETGVTIGQPVIEGAKEVQFFDWTIADVCQQLADRGKPVMLSSLAWT